MKREIIEINPLARAENTDYFFSIYHDVSLKKKGEKLAEDFSFGHFYVGFSYKDEHKSFGMNPKTSNLLNLVVGEGEVRDEEARLKNAQEYFLQSGKRERSTNCVKAIKLPTKFQSIWKINIQLGYYQSPI